MNLKLYLSNINSPKMTYRKRSQKTLLLQRCFEEKIEGILMSLVEYCWLEKNPAQLGKKWDLLGINSITRRGFPSEKSALKDSKVESEFLGADEAFGKKWMKFGWVLKHYCIWLGDFPNSRK